MRSSPQLPANVVAMWRFVGGLAIGVILWHVVAAYVVKNTFFLATPLDVWNSFWRLVQTGQMWIHIKASLTQFTLGLVPAIVVGVILGVVQATSERVSGFLDPWISGFYATPLVALTPLFIIWLGIGLATKAVIIFLLVLFPVLINTAAGIRSVEQNLKDVAISFGASRLELYWKVLLPASVPFILSGARIGAGRGVVGIFVADMFAGGGAGVGYLITEAGQVFDTATLLAGVIVLAGFGIAVTGLLRWTERRIAPWRSGTSV